MTTPGPVLFARYAYPPNALGYCGPADPAALLGNAGEAGAGEGGSVAELAALARRFDGAWPYLTLIAGANHRADPLDRAVVQAYWIGNRLLEGVPGGVFASHLEQRFRPRVGPREFPDLAELAVLGGRPHHNFHVFAVYPWVGLLRSGPAEHPLRVLNSCRIRWGHVLSVHSGHAVVRSRPLRWTGTELVLGPARPESATVAVPAGGLAPRVRPGDTVALHWDWVCDVLTAGQARALRRYTLLTLDLVNWALGRPVPARALEPAAPGHPVVVA